MDDTFYNIDDILIRYNMDQANVSVNNSTLKQALSN